MGQQFSRSISSMELGDRAWGPENPPDGTLVTLI